MHKSTHARVALQAMLLQLGDGPTVELAEEALFCFGAPCHMLIACHMHTCTHACMHTRAGALVVGTGLLLFGIGQVCGPLLPACILSE